MAVTTKKQFAATTNATTTVFSPVSIQLNNQDDLDVYVTLSGGTRVLQLRQSTGSTAQPSHPQVNNTDGLYFPAVTAGTTLYNYQLSSDNNTITFNSALPQGAVVFCERRTRDADSAYTTFASGSTIRATDLNNSATESNFTAQDARNKAFELENAIFNGSQPTVNGVIQPYISSSQIIDGGIENVDISSSAAIDGTKINPNFGSQNITTTGTVNGVSTTELSILDGATVTTNELNILDGVTSTASELNILDGVTANTSEINKLDGLTATTAELNQAAGLNAGIQTQIDGKQPLDAELTELATMGSGTASSLADLSSAEVQTLDGITASTTELNLLDGKSVVTSITGSATDTELPTAQAVNERVVELVTEVGGFTPIANETSFPATNPDINDGAGTIVSIKALSSNLVANGSGVATIANGAGSGNTVTINGLTAGSTIAAGLGILVETTSTLHTYTFHRTNIDAAGVSNAQALVNDFNDRYQISQNPPSSHPDGSALQDGDLWFDTASNIMKVYDLGNAQYDAVTSVGDFKLLTVVPDGATSGSPTFDGNIVSYDLRDGTVAANVTSVGQLIVSLNGVVQKPNAGTYNASNEGFYLEGANGIKFCTAPGSGSSLFVTLIGAAVGIGTPSDNTVNENKLTSDSVSEAKLKVSNSPVNGYFLSAQSGNTGGLTWAEVNTELAGDSSPELGGNLDVGGYYITTSNTNSNINLAPNGTGVVEIRGNTVNSSANVGTIQLNCQNNSHGVKIESPPHSANANYTLTLPTSAGSNGQALKTNGTGVLSFGNVVSNANEIISLYDQGGSPQQRLLASTEGVTVQGTSAGVSKLMFRDRTTTNFLKFKPVDTLPATVEFTLPSADGSANHYLTTNGSGVLSFGALNAAHLTGTLPALDGSNLTGLASTVADNCVYENSQTISNNYTVGTNKNAMSAGPITIASGATVTVPSGSTYTIV